MTTEAAALYARALKEGQKYQKAAAAAGLDPSLPSLDAAIKDQAGLTEEYLGAIDAPIELFAGTKTAGRVSALAGNFMPLLPENSEFAAKWMRLAQAQLGDEGISDPVKCYEYLGRFYVLEGNKRVSVLKALGAAAVRAEVTRLLPPPSDDPKTALYYEFLEFYARAGIYGVEFSEPGSYARLQAALGFEPDHIWTREERLAFSAAFGKFRRAAQSGSADALLHWLEIYNFSDIKKLSEAELAEGIKKMRQEVGSGRGESGITLSTQPSDRDKTLISKVISIARPDHLNIAFIYAFPAKESPWTHAHLLGSRQLEQSLGAQVTVRGYDAFGHDYLSAMRLAADEGAQLIIATTPAMMSDCRRLAAERSGLKILDCSLAQPYRSVRSYYCRMYECKYVTGAIAGAMCGEEAAVGYVANYPIFSVPAQINAFALGLRLSNPTARVKLVWSCIPGDPLGELAGAGVKVISNRDSAGRLDRRRALDWGLYMSEEGGGLRPLALPRWNWGLVYEKIVREIFSGAWNDAPQSAAVNYWWGMDSGAIDVELSKDLPDGVCSLAWILKDGLSSGSIEPFRTRMHSQDGRLINDGLRTLTPEELLNMDWLLDNVDGRIPGLEELTPESMETVRSMGLQRDSLLPEVEEKQL